MKRQKRNENPLTLLHTSYNGTSVSDLWHACRVYLFTDDALMRQTLEMVSRSLAPDDEQARFRYLHYLALYHVQYYRREQADAAFAEGLVLLKKMPQDAAADFLIDYIGHLLNTEQFEEAARYLTDVRQGLAEAIDSPRLKFRLLVREAWWNFLLGQEDDALSLWYQALHLFEPIQDATTKDRYFLALAYGGLGHIFEQNGDAKQALEAYQKAADVCEQYKILTRLSWQFFRIGNALAMMGDNKQAIGFFRRALQVGDSNDLLRANAFANWGRCLFNEGLHNRANQLYDKAEATFKNYPEKYAQNIALIRMWKAEIAKKNNDYDLALQYLEDALIYATKAESYSRIADIYAEISNVYAYKNLFEQAFLYQLKRVENTEKSRSDRMEQRLRALSIKYQTEHRKQEIEKLTYQTKALQLKALRAQMNPHFLFNALNSIQSFIASNDSQKAIGYLASFAKLIRRSLEYSELETISLAKEVDFLENYLYINKHLRFQDKLDYIIRVPDDLLEADIGIPSMIIQPYVENAIEHGLRPLKGGRIEVSFDLMDDGTTLRCVVTDNGVGRNNAAEAKNLNPDLQLHKSRGTQITLDRLSLLDSDFDRDDLVKIEDLLDPNQYKHCGTKVTILIPLDTE